MHVGSAESHSTNASAYMSTSVGLWGGQVAERQAAALSYILTLALLAFVCVRSCATLGFTSTRRQGTAATRRFYGCGTLKDSVEHLILCSMRSRAAEVVVFFFTEIRCNLSAIWRKAVRRWTMTSGQQLRKVVHLYS